MNTKHGSIEYKMPETMATEYLKYKNKNATNRKLTPNEYLQKIVNEEFGIKGNCVKVILF